MSNVNIQRIVENIRQNTTIYTPVVEVVVNAIQAIDEKRKETKDYIGQIVITAIRSDQTQTPDSGLRDIVGFKVSDNGIGFGAKHRNSFDTLYSDLKVGDGGKGFGRFTCLKYFDAVSIESYYLEEDKFFCRMFNMGKKTEIIVNEVIDVSEREDTGSVIHLKTIKGSGQNLLDKKLDTIARNLVEKLLPYFIAEDYECPNIILQEYDESESICLNDFCAVSQHIKEITPDKNTFHIKLIEGNETFIVRVFKFYAPKNNKSKISLVAHKREVSGSMLDKYVPEFSEEFVEKYMNKQNENSSRNYIVKAYVFSDYLDKNVSVERGTFEFSMEPNIVYEIGQVQIEEKAANIAKEAMGEDIVSRMNKKIEEVQEYVDNKAPWHKELVKEVDFSLLPYAPTDYEIELFLQKAKINQEIQIKTDVDSVLAESTIDMVSENVRKIVHKITASSKNDLVHYIAQRKNILCILEKGLGLNGEGKYESEGFVHDIVFPRKGNSDSTPFEEHNMWIFDERLNFTNLILSDVPLNGSQSERPDVIIFDKKMAFRGENEPNNPITIFEFKRPQRDDFVNPSSKEDPVEQIIRYVNDIRDGQYKTPQGRDMHVSYNTPFYGYVICDINTKVKNWLERQKNFKPMPDNMGFYYPADNINLYIEVLDWDKIVKDAINRNKIFFHKLGI